MYMRIWPCESNVDWGVELYSLTAALVILSLAECVYFSLLDKCLPSTHLVLCAIMINLHIWSAHH